MTSKEYVVVITHEALDLSIKREYNFQPVRSLQINCFPAKKIQNKFGNAHIGISGKRNFNVH